MASGPKTERPMIDGLEGFKGGARSVLTLGILAACLIVLLLLMKRAEVLFG
jgi:hypothetical protein